MTLVNSPDAVDTNVYTTMLDNTSYLTRGELKQVGYIYTTKDANAYLESGGVGQEVRGQDITLKPKTAQRLYVIGAWSNGSGGSNPQSLFNALTARLNIIPRWAGIRDV